MMKTRKTDSKPPKNYNGFLIAIAGLILIIYSFIAIPGAIPYGAEMRTGTLYFYCILSGVGVLLCIIGLIKFRRPGK